MGTNPQIFDCFAIPILYKPLFAKVYCLYRGARIPMLFIICYRIKILRFCDRYTLGMKQYFPYLNIIYKYNIIYFFFKQTHVSVLVMLLWDFFNRTITVHVIFFLNFCIHSYQFFFLSYWRHTLYYCDSNSTMPIASLVAAIKNMSMLVLMQVKTIQKSPSELIAQKGITE